MEKRHGLKQCLLVALALIITLVLTPAAVLGQTNSTIPAGTVQSQPAALVLSTQLPQEPQNQNREARLTLAVVGDIMLSRTVDKVIQRESWQVPFSLVPESIKTADIAFANLECPASFRGKPYPGKPEEVTFRANPASLFGLNYAGFDVVSLANNHTNDYGPFALLDTIASLNQLGIASCGAGTSKHEARKPVILERNGIRLAFLAYAEPIWSVVEAEDGPPEKAGVAVLREADIIADIQQATKLADGVLVSLHWGEEFHQVPRESDRALARRLIDAGALAILGHHPHVLQGAEWYRQGIILYSMGNFIFDMKDDATYDTAVAIINIHKIIPGLVPYRKMLTTLKIERLVYEPIHIIRGTYGPGILTEQDKKRIQNLIVSRLQQLNTTSYIRTDGCVEVRCPVLSASRQARIGP
ncbi:CapA family protein [Gracilinema caldarium]|nr:CapA family protein [Gracilinema caldarium]